jgi:hypothetical protein
MEFNSERAKKMLELYSQGNTLERVSKVFGITRERVRQILQKIYPDDYAKFRKIKEVWYDKLCGFCTGPIHTKIKGIKYCSKKCWHSGWKKRSDTLRNRPEKKCSQCSQILPNARFYRTNNNQLSAHCKKCHQKYIYRWKEKNPKRWAEINKNSQRRWIEAHREYSNQKARERYQANLPESRRKGAESWRKHRERLGKLVQEATKEL